MSIDSAFYSVCVFSSYCSSFVRCQESRGCSENAAEVSQGHWPATGLVDESSRDCLPHTLSLQSLSVICVSVHCRVCQWLSACCSLQSLSVIGCLLQSLLVIECLFVAEFVSDCSQQTFVSDCLPQSLSVIECLFAAEFVGLSVCLLQSL